MVVAVVHTDAVREQSVFDAVLNAVSEERRERVLRLADKADRCRSLCAAVALDACLQTVGLREWNTVLARDERGKPFLRDVPQYAISLSHSGRYAVCVLAEQPNGVDVQEIRDVRASLIERYCTAEEQQWLAARSNEERPTAFCRVWAAKESVLKAVGCGLAGVSTINVVQDGVLSAPTPWKLREYALPGHVLTVCTTEECPDAPMIISSCDSVLLR